jgi:hypothetical protein
MEVKRGTLTITAHMRMLKIFISTSGIAIFISLLVHLIIFLFFPKYFNWIRCLSVTGGIALFLVISAGIYFLINSIVQKLKPYVKFEDIEYIPYDNSLIVKFHIINDAQILLWKSYITITCDDQVIVQRANFDFSATKQGLISRDLKYPLSPGAFLAGNNASSLIFPKAETIKYFDVTIYITSLRIISSSLQVSF